MNRTVVLDVVGLSRDLIGKHTPRIQAFLENGSCAAIEPAFPAVTTTAQSNYVTGKSPSEHGIVGNGWYNRELAEVQFWKQPDRIVQSRKIWEELREIHPEFTCAKLFWWYNMYSKVDYSITPRPMYPADGRKVFDIYSWPYSIRHEIKRDLGEFPFPTFWGPAAGLSTPQGPPEAASRWIAESAKWIENRYHPTLSLVYLPHLDYNLQRLGPEHPEIYRDLERIDGMVGDLIDFFDARGVRIILLSEYGITSVNKPVHLNRLFREKGWLTIKEEMDLELLDCGASRTFAVADHQVAHLYLNDPTLEHEARSLLEATDGIGRVLGSAEKRAIGIDHPRAGDLVVEAEEAAWFTYYYWLDDARAPDFARCVDIHRKPGFDPVELFIDPAIRLPKLKIAWRLLQKKLGFRMLMDVIPLDASLVQGSHGRVSGGDANGPLVITDQSGLISEARIDSTSVYPLIKNCILE